MGMFGSNRDKHEAIGPKYRVVYTCAGEPVAKSGEFDAFEAARAEIRGFVVDSLIKRHPKGKLVAEIQQHDGRWEKVARHVIRRK